MDYAKILQQSAGKSDYRESPLKTLMKVNELKKTIDKDGRANIIRQEPYANRIQTYLSNEELKRKTNEGARQYLSGLRQYYNDIALRSLTNHPEDQDIYLKEARKQVQQMKLLKDPSQLEYLKKVDPLGLFYLEKSFEEQNQKVKEAIEDPTGDNLRKLMRGLPLNTSETSQANSTTDSVFPEGLAGVRSDLSQINLTSSARDALNRWIRAPAPAPLSSEISSKLSTAFQKDATEYEPSVAEPQSSLLDSPVPSLLQQPLHPNDIPIAMQNADELQQLDPQLDRIEAERQAHRNVNEAKGIANIFTPIQKQAGMYVSEPDPEGLQKSRVVQPKKGQKAKVSEVSKAELIDPIQQAGMYVSEPDPEGLQKSRVVQPKKGQRAKILEPIYKFPQEEAYKFPEEKAYKFPEEKIYQFDKAYKFPEEKAYKFPEEKIYQFDKAYQFPQEEAYQFPEGKIYQFDKAYQFPQEEAYQFPQERKTIELPDLVLKKNIVVEKDSGKRVTKNELVNRISQFRKGIANTDMKIADLLMIYDIVSGKSGISFAYETPDYFQLMGIKTKKQQKEYADTYGIPYDEQESIPDFKTRVAPFARGKGLKPLSSFPKHIVAGAMHFVTHKNRMINKNEYNREQAHHLIQKAKGEGFFGDLKDKIGMWLFKNVHPMGRMIEYVKNK